MIRMTNPNEISQPLSLSAEASTKINAVSPHMAYGSQQISLIAYPFGSDMKFRDVHECISVLLHLKCSGKMGFGQEDKTKVLIIS